MFQIKNLKLENFRIHKNFFLETNNKIICVTGRNGAGKTSILEAISFFSKQTGFKKAKFEDIPYKKSSENCFIQVDIEHKKKLFVSKIIFEKKNDKFQKKLFIDNKKILDLKEYFNNTGFLWLTPSMDNIMYLGKSERRRFLDKIFSEFDNSYKENLKNINKLLGERLILLKGSKEDKWIEILEKKICDLLWKIYLVRRDIILELNKILEKKIKKYSDVMILLKNKYENFDYRDNNKFLDFYLKKIFSKREIDKILYKNSVSPNLDEFYFINNSTKSDSEQSSTGEQKKILSSLVLSFIYYFELKGLDLLILLDELPSHFDSKNLSIFLEEIASLKFQIWITGTDKKSFQSIENNAFFVNLD